MYDKDVINLVTVKKILSKDLKIFNDCLSLSGMDVHIFVEICYD